MSAYNVRLYDYKHSQQLRIYTKAVNQQSEDDKKADIKNNDKDEKEKEEQEQTEPDYERSYKVSTNRTKQKIYEITRANTWDWFITLTFDRNKIDSSNYDLLLEKVRKWFNNVKLRKAPNMKYIIIPELHKDGIHYHFHGLLADCSQLTFVDSGIVQNGKVVYNISDFKYGFTTATKVEDTRKVSSYISKYITKDLEIHIKGKRRFLASKNCEKVNIIDYHMTEEEIETLMDSIALDITHMKTQDIPDAHQRIKYIELKKE